MASARRLLPVLLLALAAPSPAQSLPPKAQESFDQAFGLMQRGKVAGAIAKYEEALAIAPLSKELLLEYVVALRKGCRYQQSAKAGWQLLEVDPSNAAAWGNLGNTFLAAEEWEGAALAFDKVTTLGKDKAQAVQNLLNLGHVQCEAGDPAGALKVFAKAAKLDPKNGLTLVDTAIAQSRLGNKKAAVDNAHAALALLAKQNDARGQTAKQYAEAVLKQLEADAPIPSERPPYRQALPKAFAKQPPKGKAAALEVGKDVMHVVQVGKARLASLAAPETWTLLLETPDRRSEEALLATLSFVPPPGARFQALLSFIDADKSIEQVKQEVEFAGTLLLPSSVERTLDVRELTSATVHGHYFSVQDKSLVGKEPPEGQFPFCTQGVLRVGDVSCTFTLLTFDREPSTMTPLLALLQGLAVKPEEK